jgi:hypothetical protein
VEYHVFGVCSQMPPQTDLDHVHAHYRTFVDRNDTLVITAMKSQLSAMEEVPISEDEPLPSEK